MEGDPLFERSSGKSSPLGSEPGQSRRSASATSRGSRSSWRSATRFTRSRRSQVYKVPPESAHGAFVAHWLTGLIGEGKSLEEIAAELNAAASAVKYFQSFARGDHYIDGVLNAIKSDGGGGGGGKEKAAVAEGDDVVNGGSEAPAQQDWMLASSAPKTLRPRGRLPRGRRRRLPPCAPSCASWPPTRRRNMSTGGDNSRQMDCRMGGTDDDVREESLSDKPCAPAPRRGR
jgi:hypothetical protein